jgi:hypothetical protein
MSSPLAGLARPVLLLSISALVACSTNSQIVAPAAPSGVQSSLLASGVQTSVLPTGEHEVRVGARTIRFGGLRRHASGGRGWMTPDARTRGLLYGSSYDGGFINIYHERGTNQSPIGQLTSGLTSPQGIVVDQHHRLWVANTNAFNVVAFKRGATAPFRTLNDPGYYPIGVAVDSNGTVFAANAEGTNGPPGNVTVWAKGSSNPSETLTYSNFQIVLGIGVDASNNVYVSYIPISGPPSVVVFPAGSQTGQPLAIQDTTISDITFDSSANLVMEDGSGGLGIWDPPYTSGPNRTLSVFGNEPTLSKTDRNVWIAYANPSFPMIEGYNYTTGAKIDTITSGFTTTAIPYGVALDPASAP